VKLGFVRLVTFSSYPSVPTKAHQSTFQHPERDRQWLSRQTPADGRAHPGSGPKNTPLSPAIVCAHLDLVSVVLDRQQKEKAAWSHWVKKLKATNLLQIWATWFERWASILSVWWWAGRLGSEFDIRNIPNWCQNKLNGRLGQKFSVPVGLWRWIVHDISVTINRSPIWMVLTPLRRFFATR
jgi:hypothetical protein